MTAIDQKPITDPYGSPISDETVHLHDVPDAHVYKIVVLYGPYRIRAYPVGDICGDQLVCLDDIATVLNSGSLEESLRMYRECDRYLYHPIVTLWDSEHAHTLLSCITPYHAWNLAEHYGDEQFAQWIKYHLFALMDAHCETTAEGCYYSGSEKNPLPMIRRD